MWGRKKIGLRVETFMAAGRWQHQVYEFGLKRGDRSEEISDDVVEAQKRTNEALYDHMPEGSGKVISRIYYTPPKK